MASKQDSICYTKNPIKQFIIRADFASENSELASTLKKEIVDDLRRTFPIIEPVATITQQISVGVQSGPKSQPVKNVTEWNFYSINRKERVLITSNSFLLECIEYNSYADKRTKFHNVSRILQKYYSSITFRRYGMRFVNEIDLNSIRGDFSWDKYLNSALIKTLNFQFEHEKISRAMNILEYNLDNHQVKFNFGIPNPDYPALIKKKQFILDIDAYCTGLFFFEDLEPTFDTLHSSIQSIFEKSITDKLRDYYGRKK